MIPTLVDLTLEIRSEDGSCAEFFQDQEDSVDRALRLLANPRLFAQPLLVLASPYSISVIPCRTIDMILASTLAPAPVPWPTGFLDIVEVPGHDSSAGTPERGAIGGDSDEPTDTSTTDMHIHTHGSWVVTLKATVMAQSTAQDQRLLLAHFFDLPVLPFRLAAGGIGFINPANISQVTAQQPLESGRVSEWVTLHSVPETALPARLLQRTARFPRPEAMHEPRRLQFRQSKHHA